MDAWRRQLETETRSRPDRPECTAGQDVARVPALCIVGHPDTSRVGERAHLFELSEDGELALSRLAPLFSAPGEALRRPLADPRLSRRPLLLRRTGEHFHLDARGTSTVVRLGDEQEGVEERRLTSRQLADGLVLCLAETVVLHLQLSPAPARRPPSFGLVGESAAMLEVRREIRRAAATDLPVLVRGETGTGKELVAEAVHRASGRPGPFIAVNMAALTPSLAMAELFGAAKGAFTGAEHARRGFFERAEGGTLFLDEIGETPPEIQAALLRALETRTIQPLGSDETRAVDFRLVAATDAALEAAVESGGFRAPLLHRLAGFEIHLPPLRRRRDDITPLFLHFLAGEGADTARENLLPAAQVGLLLHLPWPGNVRQLRHAARRFAALLVEDDDGLADAHRLLAELAREAAVATAGDTVAHPDEEQETKDEPGRDCDVQNDRAENDRAESDEDRLLDALRRHRFRLQPTARSLGLSRAALYRRIAKSPHLRLAGEIGGAELSAALESCGGDLDRLAEALMISRHALSRRLRELGLL